MLVFGGDGLVREQIRTDVLERTEEHGPAGGVGVVARMRMACSSDGRSSVAQR